MHIPVSRKVNCMKEPQVPHILEETHMTTFSLTQVTYKQLVHMVLRLVRHGMSDSKAIRLVSQTYAIDPQQLEEYIQNHSRKEV